MTSSGKVSWTQDTMLKSFEGKVHLDLAADNSGTEYPNGTPFRPVNNLKDAVTIAITFGFLPIVMGPVKPSR